jgi:Flp pilus assembly CpaE family ATPase
MENTLRGVVLAKFPNISEFAKEMNWDRKKASRIVNRVQPPTVSDMEKMTACLGVNNADSFVQIFLPSIPTLWEKQ